MSPSANVCADGSLRGHIWTSRAFIAATQRQALQAAGAHPIYEDEFENALRSLRGGSRLVVDGLRGVGRSESEIGKNIDRVHAKGAAVMDARTGRLSTKHCEELIAEALKAITNERRGPRKFTRKDRRMPWDQVAPIYFSLLKNRELEAAVAVNGYAPMSYHTMWRHFKKPRGVPVGRPSHRI